MLCCVGLTIDKKINAYINKQDYKVLHEIGITDDTGVLKNPQPYKVRTRSPGAIEQILKSINSTMTKAMSNPHRFSKLRQLQL